MLCVLLFCFTTHGASRFNVIAFYTGKNDLAHISFVHEANQWFPKMALKYHFAFDSTTNWTDLNTHFLSHYQVVIFLDTRPEAPAQRAAFEQYMKGGGAWMGFHFSAFALTPSAYPQNWDWYHNVFLGSGEYVFDKTNRTLSFTFADQIQDKLVIDSLLWLGKS
ncbi:MAG TPA: ThuA domain-containing protein [Candidatus Sulfotelmatobacter sp.]|nr:ThuA domain-containing protein [Candidatus Sulfotelmatobacter sp.]